MAIPFADVVNVITFLPGYRRAPSSYASGVGTVAYPTTSLDLSQSLWTRKAFAITFTRNRTVPSMVISYSVRNMNTVVQLLYLTLSIISFPAGFCSHEYTKYM